MIIFSANEKREPDFTLAENTFVTGLFVDPNDHWGVNRAVADLKKDLQAVTGQEPPITTAVKASFSKETVLIGTIGKSPLIDGLIAEGRLNVSAIQGKWESFTIQVLKHPLAGVDNGLFIIGSDQRGTIYGIYELCRRIGVSPWSWWADVPVKKSRALYVRAGTYTQGEPSVKYRGLFLNDEAPSLTTWVQQKFGGFNHHFYEKVFQLLLRLKANFLWPAMWKPRVFNAEDPLNPKLAALYGIVMGTSHHEPMMRSWSEWGQAKKGAWNYNTNAENIYDFWFKGLERVKDFESIITLGMRGDGDEAMLEKGTLAENQRLLERIIRDQREIIQRLVNKELSTIPQVLALYKEVQGFYEAGLKIPEDITLLLADDNFGNIRMLPGAAERNRPGGYGLYYHFDYVGGPRSYQWINTVPLQKIWDQMHLTYDHGVDRIWIVNVGDLKPMELPLDFFLAMAWDINQWDYDEIHQYTVRWAEEQFSPEHAATIAEILLKYTKYNGRRKPEIVEEDTFSLINYREAERVLAEFETIVEKAERLAHALPPEQKDAFFQLVLYPTRASRNVLKMQICAGKNQFFAAQGRISANDNAALTEETFAAEAADTDFYHKDLAKGKWDGMMLQPHIGEANWRGPEKNTMPTVKTVPVLPGAEMGIYLEEGEQALDPHSGQGTLPSFSRFTRNQHYIEIFNKKADPFTYRLQTMEPWIKVSNFTGKVATAERIEVWIDWEKAPVGEGHQGTILISGTDQEYRITVPIFNPTRPTLEELEAMTFVESNGYISIEAEHYSRNCPADGVQWVKFPDYGRTLSSMLLLPTTAESYLPPETGPYLEYRLYLFTPGTVGITLYTAPTLNFNREHGLRYAISLDAEEPMIADLFPVDCDANDHCPRWAQAVLENVHKSRTQHVITAPGYHTLRIQMVDPGLTLQKIVLDTGGVKHSYLGPPESYFKA